MNAIKRYFIRHRKQIRAAWYSTSCMVNPRRTCDLDTKIREIRKKK